MEIRKDIAYGEEPEQLLDIYPAERADKTLVFFHGGGLDGCTKEENADAFAVLAQNGISVVSVEYRMYPRARYPDFIEDGARAVAWVSQHAAEQGLTENLYVGGSSAGAYIAMMLCFDPAYLKPYGVSNIQGYLFDAGQPTVHFRVLKERGLDPRRIVVDNAAPLYHVGTKEEVPPVLILAAGNDISGRLEQLALLAKTMEDFGHKNVTFRVLENFSHCGYCHAADAEGNLIYPKILLEFLNGQSGTVQ